MMEATSSSEAIELKDEVIKDFIDKNKAINTVRKTRSDLNMWYRWCEGVKETRELAAIPPCELNRLLSHFCHSKEEKW